MKGEPEPKRFAIARAKGSRGSVGGGPESALATFEKKSIVGEDKW